MKGARKPAPSKAEAARARAYVQKHEAEIRMHALRALFAMLLPKRNGNVKVTS